MCDLDIPGAILAFGIVFWLAGGANWLKEVVRKLKLENDLKEKEIKRYISKDK
jgi:hypothetical protein